MSVESIAIAMNHSAADGAARMVLVGIANHDGDGGAWPSIAKLARYAKRSERTVQRAVNELEELGEIIVHEQAGGDAETRDDRRPNLYEFILECPPECDRSKNHRVPGDPGYGVTRMSPRGRRRGDTGDAHGVTQMSPEPSVEPSTPQPPAQRGAGCAKHTTPASSCRGCGTTARQVEETMRRSRRDLAKARATKALLDERAAIEASRVDSTHAGSHLATMRASIGGRP